MGTLKVSTRYSAISAITTSKQAMSSTAASSNTNRNHVTNDEGRTDRWLTAAASNYWTTGTTSTMTVGRETSGPAFPARVTARRVDWGSENNKMRAGTGTR